MRDKYYGKLFYNYNNERMGIYYDDGSQEDGLHCGQTMEVKIEGEWIQTRLEMSDSWYLVGIKHIELTGLEVRL